MTTEPNIVLFTGVAVLAALTTSCASPVAKTGPAPAAAIGEVAEGGNAPVAMPVRLPDGYEFGGSVGVNHRRGEPVATAWMFESVAESNAVPVVVCVRGKGRVRRDLSGCGPPQRLRARDLPVPSVGVVGR